MSGLLLEKLTRYLSDDVSEVMINKPGQIYLDRIGQRDFECIEAPELKRETLKVLAHTISGLNHKEFGEERPLLNSILPTGERVQIVQPPACIDEQFIISIRRDVNQKFTLQSYQDSGYFNNTRILESSEERRLELAVEGNSIALLKENRIAEGLKQAVIEKKAIMICGAMSAGKTKLAGALLDCIPSHERIGCIEDTKELDFKLDNCVRLIANEDSEYYNGGKLIEVCYRLLLGRIIVGELRNSLVVQYFRSLMTTCKGNITTSHATAPHEAIELITDLYRTAVPEATPEDIKRMFKASIDILVFADYDGKIRDCGSIYLPKFDRSLG